MNAINDKKKVDICNCSEIETKNKTFEEKVKCRCQKQGC